jgi:hypothetical protein
MTSHGLVRCSPERLLAHASQQHRPPGADEPATTLAGWRYDDRPADRSTSWRTRLPDGSLVEWCLEVEPGANGALAHLSASLAAGRMARLPARLQRLALRRWTGHELAVLAREVERTGAA